MQDDRSVDAQALALRARLRQELAALAVVRGETHGENAASQGRVAVHGGLRGVSAHFGGPIQADEIACLVRAAVSVGVKFGLHCGCALRRRELEVCALGVAVRVIEEIFLEGEPGATRKEVQEQVLALLRSLGDAGDLKGLEGFSLANMKEMGPETVDFVGERLITRIPRLKRLGLISCGLRDEAVRNLCEYLLASQAKGTLNSLDLSQNRILLNGAQSLALLIESDVPIKELVLKENCIGSAGLDTISIAMHRTNRLEMLDVSSNEIDIFDGLQSLFDFLSEGNCSLKTLIMKNSATPLENESMSLVESIFRGNQSLETIDLKNDMFFVQCDEARLKSLPSALHRNPTLCVCEFGEFDQRLVRRDILDAVLKRIEKTLGNNRRLLGMISPRGKEIVSFSRDDVTGEDDDRFPPRQALNEFPDEMMKSQEAVAASPSRSSSQICTARHTQEVEVKYRELKAALQAMRRRTRRHHSEIESRVSGRLFELESRAEIVAEHVNPHDYGVQAASEDFAQERLGALESVFFNVRKDFMKMNASSQELQTKLGKLRSLTSQGSSQRSSSISSTSEMNRILDRHFREATGQVHQLQHTFMHDFEKKQEMWQQKLEKHMELVVKRVDVLEKGVVAMQDDNIFALESLLSRER